MDEWNYDDRSNPTGNQRARRAERAQVLWRTHRRDRKAFLTLRRQSGITMEPMAPLVRGPNDSEDSFFDLQGQFRSSTTQNLVSIHAFQLHANEGLERMFVR